MVVPVPSRISMVCLSAARCMVNILLSSVFSLAEVCCSYNESQSFTHTCPMSFDADSSHCFLLRSPFATQPAACSRRPYSTPVDREDVSAIKAGLHTLSMVILLQPIGCTAVSAR